MTSINNFSTLQAQTKRILEAEDDDDFDAYLPTAISLAQQRLNREVDSVNLYEFNTSTTFATSTATVAKPSDYRSLKSVFITASTSYTQMLHVSYDYLSEYWPNRDLVGTPKYIADLDSSNWIIAPTPKENFSARIHYREEDAEISASNQENILTTPRFSDLLYYATVIEMCYWQKNPSWAREWESRYQQTLGSVNNEGRMERRDDGKVPNNPEPNQNTVTGSN